MKNFFFLSSAFLFLVSPLMAIEITEGQYTCEQTTLTISKKNKTEEKKQVQISTQIDKTTFGYIPNDNGEESEISLPLLNIYVADEDFPFLSIPYAANKLKKETTFSQGGNSTLYVYVTKFSNSAKLLSMSFELSGCFGGSTNTNLKLSKIDKSKFKLEILSKDVEESIKDTLICQLNK